MDSPLKSFMKNGESYSIQNFTWSELKDPADDSKKKRHSPNGVTKFSKSIMHHSTIYTAISSAE